MSLPLAEAMIDAASLAIAGKKEDALAELCRSRDAGHQSPKLYDAIGHLQFDLRQFEAAAATYDTSLRLSPGDSLTYYNRAVCLEKMEAWEEAATAFHRAIELDSRRASAYLGLGISRLHLGNPQQALEAFEKCLERQPFREAALRGQAVALHLLQRDQEASECYQRLLSRDPQSEELLCNAISLAITRGDYEWLAQCCGRLIEIQPASPIALEGAALAAFAKRDFDVAYRFCNALVEALPSHFAGWFNCGVALQKMGLYEKAADAYARAASLDPESAEAFLSLGTVLQEIERLPAARESYERSLDLAPEGRTALWNLALLFEAQKEFRQAEGLYARLVKHHSDAQDAWFRLGYVRLQLGDFSASIQAFQACLALPKKCPEALLNIGIAQWNTRNLEMAKETFRQSLTSASTFAPALRCLAAIALLQQDYDQALALHKQLLELDEPTSDLLYNVALLFQKRGRAAEAVRYYRQALALRADFSQALLNLGHALMSLGKHEEAQTAWQTAVRSNIELAEQFLV
jgi:tetratricopeptide (TPR) repeat protein